MADIAFAAKKFMTSLSQACHASGANRISCGEAQLVLTDPHEAGHMTRACPPDTHMSINESWVQVCFEMYRR
jgi:hypothetical protein